MNLAPSHPSIVLDLLRELRDYKETMVPSIRRKKIDLSPYLKNMVPTPIHLTDPQNSESFFVDVDDTNRFFAGFEQFDYSVVTDLPADFGPFGL